MVVGRCVLHPACEGSWHETDTVLCLWPSSLDFVWGCALLTPSLGFAPWARLWRSKTVPDGFVLTPSLGFALRARLWRSKTALDRFYLSKVLPVWRLGDRVWSRWAECSFLR
ncbi:protein of unknown function [Methylocaldum szegediense]|jgi:hypothetical protein|uniref:Uncharacterized protein n=1 Tax=Methylocaldum szegediense TaxID=73780 RepID=A0ABN8WZV3_9GAMM|nr:protein of unknown function [Methylocaldum szegediense]